MNDSFLPIVNPIALIPMLIKHMKTIGECVSDSTQWLRCSFFAFTVCTNLNLSWHIKDLGISLMQHCVRKWRLVTICSKHAYHQRVLQKEKMRRKEETRQNKKQQIKWREGFLQHPLVRPLPGTPLQQLDQRRVQKYSASITGINLLSKFIMKQQVLSLDRGIRSLIIAITLLYINRNLRHCYLFRVCR